MFPFPVLLLSRKIILNIYFTFNCASFQIANTQSFFIDLVEVI